MKGKTAVQLTRTSLFAQMKQNNKNKKQKNVERGRGQPPQWGLAMDLMCTHTHNLMQLHTQTYLDTHTVWIYIHLQTLTPLHMGPEARHDRHTKVATRV